MIKKKISQICPICKKPFSSYKTNKRTFCSNKCKFKWRKSINVSPATEFKKGHAGIKGAKNYAWKGDNTSYRAIHQWLLNNFGYPVFCEKCNKKGERKIRWNIHYALIYGKKYQHLRENFICLCVSCHKKYDIKLKKS